MVQIHDIDNEYKHNYTLHTPLKLIQNVILLTPNTEIFHVSLPSLDSCILDEPILRRNPPWEERSLVKWWDRHNRQRAIEDTAHSIQ